MKLLKFFAKVLSYLFIVVFGALCLLTVVFFMVKGMISYDSINGYVKNANIFDYSSQEVNADSKTLRQVIEKELLDMDVPVLATDEVLDSKELNTILGDYAYNYSKYLVFDNQKPSFPDEKIVKIIEDTYVKHEKKSLSVAQKQDISKYVTSLGDKIDSSVFDKNEASEIFGIDAFDVLTPVFSSEYTEIVMITLLVVLFIITGLCLGSLKRVINWCGKAVIADGVLLIVLSFLEVRFLIMYFNSRGLIDNLAILVVEKGFQNMLLYGGILIGVGILLMVMSAILLKKEKTKKSSTILNEVIDSEIEHSNEVDRKFKNKKQVENEKTESVVSDEIPEKPLEEKDSDLQEQVPEVKEENVEKDMMLVNASDTELVPVSEEDKLPTVVEEKTEKVDENKQDIDNKAESSEVKEEKAKVKEDIKIVPLREIKLEVVQPKKGKDIEYKPVEEEEEEIELL